MMLISGRLGKFVMEIIDTIAEEKNEKVLWEFWLHKDFERSWKEFRESLNDKSSTNAAPTQETMKKTVIASANLLKNFRPNSGGEQGGTVQTVRQDSD